MRVLLIGATTGYQTRVFAEAAERLGLELILATDRCHVLDDPWGDRALALRFEDPEGSAQTLAAQPRFDGIVAVGDRPAYIAAARGRAPWCHPLQLARIPSTPAAISFWRASSFAPPDCWFLNFIACPWPKVPNARPNRLATLASSNR